LSESSLSLSFCPQQRPGWKSWRNAATPAAFKSDLNSFGCKLFITAKSRKINFEIYHSGAKWWLRGISPFRGWVLFVPEACKLSFYVNYKIIRRIRIWMLSFMTMYMEKEVFCFFAQKRGEEKLKFTLVEFVALRRRCFFLLF